MENTKVAFDKITFLFSTFSISDVGGTFVLLEELLCFQHFQLVLLYALLCFPYIENTKAAIDKIPKKVQKGVTFVFFLFCVLCSPEWRRQFEADFSSVQQQTQKSITLQKSDRTVFIFEQSLNAFVSDL